jgi:LuxR family transcriptional regulator, maltose regulon positive regulatory protein
MVPAMAQPPSPDLGSNDTAADFRSRLKGDAIARIAPPRLPEIVARPRLFEQLDKGRAYPMIWVGAPTGGGKTTLASSYLSDRALPAVWYSADASDLDIASFFHYFALATGRLAPDADLPAFTVAHYPSLMAFARRFFEAVALALPADAMVVLDNYQAVPDDAPLHAVLNQAVEWMPRGQTLLVLSRDEPTGHFSSAMAGRRIFSLGAQSMRLTEEESQAVVRMHSGNGASPDPTADLYSRTGGWAAGLILSLERRRQDDALIAAGSGSRGMLLDYLATEVFERLPEATRSLLLKTSFLPHVTPEIADAVTGRNDGSAILANLCRRHYLVSRVDSPHETYQYHALLREFLSSESRSALAPDDLRAAQRAAADVLLRNGQTDAAIDLLLSAGDWMQAASQILARAPDMVAKGRSLTVANWLDKIPGETLDAEPWLFFWLGMSCLMSAPERALGQFARCHDLFKARDDRFGMGASIASALDVLFINQKGPAATGDWIGRLDALHARPVACPDPDSEGRAWTSILRALSWRQPDHPRIQAWLTRAGEVWCRMTDTDARVGLGSVLHFLNFMSGQRARADGYGRLLEGLLADAQGVSALHAILCRIHFAYVQCGSGETGQAIENVNLALDLADHSGIRLGDAFALGALVDALLLGADLAAADKGLVRMEACLRGLPENLDKAHYEMLLGWRALIAGDVEVAIHHTERSLHMARHFGAQYPVALCRLGLARLHLERADFAAAESEIAKARAEKQEVFAALINYQCEMFAAVASFSSARDAQGIDHLRKGLALGCAGGFGQPLWMDRTMVAGLCARALAEDIETGFVRRLSGRLGLGPSVQGPTLSAREREVLRLVAKGMNRADTAAILGIGATTVASHIQSVYRKLGISTRAEAAVEAVRLGLLRP